VRARRLYDDAAEEVEFGEISVFLGQAFVITVRQGVASELHGARQRLERRPELLAAGSSAVLWAILDQVVDDYAPVVAGLSATSIRSRPPCSPAPPRRHESPLRNRRIVAARRVPVR
jgi:Mg2+ and Co2+ transporter CorA